MHYTPYTLPFSFPKPHSTNLVRLATFHIRRVDGQALPIALYEPACAVPHEVVSILASCITESLSREDPGLDDTEPVSSCGVVDPAVVDVVSEQLSCLFYSCVYRVFQLLFEQCVECLAHVHRT